MLNFFIPCLSSFFLFFFFNDTATTEIYTLSLHDALPIFVAGNDDLAQRRNKVGHAVILVVGPRFYFVAQTEIQSQTDRKSTRLNSSHSQISYAVFCLKKKKNINTSL